MVPAQRCDGSCPKEEPMFTQFLEHVMKNFEASYPYGLSKTEVTRLTFLAWCMKEASVFEKAHAPTEQP